MDEEAVFYWKPFGVGLYVACSILENFIGFAFTCAYIPSERVFQIMLHVGNSALAIGWDFNYEEM